MFYVNPCALKGLNHELGYPNQMATKVILSCVGFVTLCKFIYSSL